jgi:hypothetical protein
MNLKAKPMVLSMVHHGEVVSPFLRERVKAASIHLGLLVKVGRNSVVGIATRYGLDGPGIESRLGRDFQHPSRRALGPAQPPTQQVPGVKRPGRGVDHPPPSSARVKERVELHLYSPSGPSWPVLGRHLPLPISEATLSL